MEVRLERHESNGGVVVAALEQGHVLLPDFLVLVKEHGNEPLLHEFLFLVEKPSHAVDKDGAFGALANGWHVFQEFSVAESDDGIPFLQDCPIIGSVDMDAQTDHFQIKGFIFKSSVGGDDMDVNTHVEPDQNLVVEFGSRAPVETGEPVDIDLFQCGAHEIMELDVERIH